LCTA
jgi:Cyclophilin type peptidyl-prolyl cis-trans isomerase/CLD